MIAHRLQARECRATIRKWRANRPASHAKMTISGRLSGRLAFQMKALAGFLLTVRAGIFIQSSGEAQTLGG